MNSSYAHMPCFCKPCHMLEHNYVKKLTESKYGIKYNITVFAVTSTEKV